MVNWENYEEYMLRYADNELNTAEREALFVFVKAHPELRKELELYQATRLIPDIVVFEHKDTLLKKGGGAISLGKWWMYATAAAVILFAVFITRQNGRHEDFTVPVAKTGSVHQSVNVQPKTDTTQKLHSTPVKPVTIENTLARHQPARVNHKKNYEPRTIQPTPQAKEETYVAKEVPKPKEVSIVSVAEQKEEKTVVAVDQPTVNEQAKQQAPTEPVTEKKHRKLLAWLPINRQRSESANIIADAVNEKLGKLKEIKNNLKDSDLTFKIGKRELFVVKL